MPTILAIDPGAGGSLAWVTTDGHLIDVADMPVVEVRGKRRVSAAGLASLIATREVDRVVIEGVNAMPKQGVASSFTFGYAAGLCEGVAVGFGLPVQIIPSATWKRKAGVPADKGAARQMAQRLWPGAVEKFARVRDDGRAEAALLGRWASGSDSL
jgi:crossover junction endodeoxyribonuclease RuvC